MPNKKILLLILPIFALACSFSIVKPPAAQIVKSLSTEQKTPTPGIPAPTITATAEALETCTITADALNLRDAPDLPGFESHVIAWLYAGDVVFILPDPAVETWITVQTETLTGWINSKFCERNQP